MELPVELRLSVTDVVLDSVRIAADSRGTMLPRMPVGPVAHLVAAAAANSALLRDIGDMAAVHEFAVQLRAQVTGLHATMRLPHLGVNRAVPYHQLYVEPQLRPPATAPGGTRLERAGTSGASFSGPRRSRRG